MPAVPGRFALLFICLSRLPLPARRSPTPLRAARPLYVSSSRSDADSLPLQVSSSLSFRTHSRYSATLYRVGLKIVLYSTSRQRQTRPPPHQLATQDETRTRTNSLLTSPHRLCFSLFLFPQASHLLLYSLTVLANSILTEPAPPSSDTPFLSFCFIVFLFVLTIFFFYSSCASCQCATTKRSHPLCFAETSPIAISSVQAAGRTLAQPVA